MYCLVVGGAMGYFIPANHLGLIPTDDLSILNTPEKVKLAIFTGGEDVDPSLYGHVMDRTTGSNIRRDKYEVGAFHALKEFNIPKVGICRGAQFLCVMAGGSLIQDVTGHGSNHYLVFRDKDGAMKKSPEKVTSTHHQMQYPWDLPEDNFKVLAGSPSPISNHYVWNNRKYYSNQLEIPQQFWVEPDVVHYPKINALGIQYHPEWMPENSWGMIYARGLISSLVNGDDI